MAKGTDLKSGSIGSLGEELRRHTDHRAFCEHVVAPVGAEETCSSGQSLTSFRMPGGLTNS